MPADRPVEKTIRVTLGGVPLTLRDGEEHAWTITTGVRPHQRVFEMSTHRARAIFERAGAQLTVDSAASGTRTRDRPSPVGPLTFEIHRPNVAPLIVRGLYILATQPGSDPNTLSVLVSDRRWLLTRELVERSYNIRRTTGERRILNGSVVPIQVAPRAADYAYRRTSLKDGIRPWTAREILDDLLLECFGEGGFAYDDELNLQDGVEGLTTPRAADEALEAAFAFLPGVTIYPGIDGLIHVLNTLSGREQAAVKAAGVPLWGGGNWALVDRSQVRPPHVEVYLDREQELRFDFRSEELQTMVRGREPLTLENVLPCPDPTLTLASGRVVHQGTWITVDEALAAWALLADFPAPVGALTQKKIRRHYLAGFSRLHNFYSLDAKGHPSEVWTRRIDAVAEHWRRTFRILPQWMDKLRGLKAYRVAVLDQETGTRARAAAYFDHTVKPSFRTLIKRGAAALGWEVNGWAVDLTSARVGPADVEVLDEDNGIIRVTPRVDPWGVAAEIAPGKLDGPVPTMNAGQSLAVWSRVGLKQEFRLAVVLSGVPDAPNNERRLHRETVRPEDAVGLLPGVANVGACRGPVWHVSAGDETARFAWIDAQADAIRESVYTGAELPRALLVNPDTVRDVARAQAARIYAWLLDRVEGSFRVSLNPTVVPAGSLTQVTHSARRAGRAVLATTYLALPPILVPPSIPLPERTRRILRRFVQT